MDGYYNKGATMKETIQVYVQALAMSLAMLAGTLLVAGVPFWNWL